MLYFENAGSVRSWTNPSGNNLAARLAKLADARAFTEELYLSVLTRFPADAEIEELAAFIAQGAPELVRHSPDSDFLPVLLPHNN